MGRQQIRDAGQDGSHRRICSQASSSMPARFQQSSQRHPVHSALPTAPSSHWAPSTRGIRKTRPLPAHSKVATRVSEGISTQFLVAQRKRIPDRTIDAQLVRGEMCRMIRPIEEDLTSFLERVRRHTDNSKSSNPPRSPNEMQSRGLTTVALKF
jgi:hypothetical protein